MASLVIVDDPNIEVAVLIDTDVYQALPVVAMGENRVALLTAFMDTLPPYDWFTTEGLQQAWVSFLGTQGVGTEPVDTDAPGDGEVVTPPRNGTDAEAELATAEAASATDTPAPQPADADVAADQGQASEVVRCWNCQGSGFVTFGDDEPQQQCGICRGTGKVTQPAQV